MGQQRRLYCLVGWVGWLVGCLVGQSPCRSVGPFEVSPGDRFVGWVRHPVCLPSGCEVELSIWTLDLYMQIHAELKIMTCDCVTFFGRWENIFRWTSS